MRSIHYTNAVLTIIALALSVIAVENIVRPSHYTNAVLTIIALVLSVIAVENIVRPSAAQSSSLQPVAICDIVNHNCLDVEGIGLQPHDPRVLAANGDDLTETDDEMKVDAVEQRRKTGAALNRVGAFHRLVV